jgi:hypothetical protein
MARASRKAKTTSVKVNFKGVESRQTPPEGDYKLEVLEANSKTGPSGDMIEFILEISEGKFKGQKQWFYCPLAENSLWKLHAFLTALGEEVPEDEMDIDLSDLIGKEVVGVLTHETYQGKKRAKMTDFASVEDYEGELASEDDDDEDEKPAKKGAKGKAKSKSSDDDDDDEEDEKPKAKKGKAKAKPADDDDDDEEEAPKSKAKAKGKKKPADDDDDEDEKPAAKGKKGAAKSKKAKKYTTAEIEDMDEDELQELLEKHDLEDEVDLDDFKKLPKKVAAVIDALEEADLIEDDD